MIRVSRSFLLCLLALGMAGGARADQVVMKNGDRITGMIVKQDGKTITVKTDLFGVVSAPWDQVASVESQQQLNVVLKDGRTLAGTVSTTEGQLAIATPTSKTAVPPAEVTAMRNPDEQHAFDRLQHPTLMQLWQGSSSVGLAGANGNAETLTFTAAFDAARVTNTDKTSIHFDAIRASAFANGSTATTAQAVRGGVAYNHNINPRLFVNAFNDYEYDRFQSLDLRFVLGGGFGFHAVKGPRATLDFLGGADYNHASFSTPLTQSNGEVFWGNDYILKLSAVTSLNESFRMFDDLSDTSSYRVNFDLAFATRLNRFLTWNVALSDRFLSQPVPGRKTNDWLYSTGVGMTFGK
jgi:putative salt-induced outer membrane protein YdiY